MVKQCVGAALIVSFAASCMPNMLPAVAAPEQVMPPIPPSADVGAPPAGQGQVAIDADAPALVEQVTGTYEGVTSEADVVSGLTYATVCAHTPCVANLALGPQQLRLTSLTDPSRYGTDSVVVTARPTDYRYALGHVYDPPVRGLVPAVVGLTAVMVGATLLGVSADWGTPLDPGSFGPYAYGALIGGAVLGVVGAVLLHDSLTSATMQPGTGVQWTP